MARKDTVGGVGRRETDWVWKEMVIEEIRKIMFCHLISST